MNEFENPPENGAPEAAPGDAGDNAYPVDIGKALPPADAQRLPVLSPAVQPVGDTAADSGGSRGSTIAQGMQFVGNATLTGPCSVGGEVEGHLRQAAGADIAVVVTETGRVKGDITARRISIMGRTDGILDAGTGEVSLHDGADVQGMVRYGRIQVNGANLNATLERVVPRQDQG